MTLKIPSIIPNYQKTNSILCIIILEQNYLTESLSRITQYVVSLSRITLIITKLFHPAESLSRIAEPNHSTELPSLLSVNKINWQNFLHCHIKIGSAFLNRISQKTTYSCLTLPIRIKVFSDMYEYQQIFITYALEFLFHGGPVGRKSFDLMLSLCEKL